MTFPTYATLGGLHIGDPHTLLWSAAREGRFDEVEASIRKLEVRTIRNHGAKSPEATHWIEVRAVVARIAGNHGLASQLWLAAARFHSSPPNRELRAARTCLDQAFHEWGNIEDDRVAASLAPTLRAMYHDDPSYRPDVPDAIDRRLLYMSIRGQG
ncbi:hypothetical protein [Streptomyces spiralis]|nr:hypothetical protein [Streptomyces spiralis]